MQTRRPNPQQDMLAGMQEVKSFNLLATDQDLLKFIPVVNHPEALTDDMLRSIGKAYLKLYPKKDTQASCWPKFFSLHTQQDFAEQLANCQQETSLARWQFAANIYAQLKNVRGNIAMTLLYVFGWAFNKEYKLFVSAPFSQAGMAFHLLTPTQVAQQLNDSIAQYAILRCKKHL